MKIKDYISKNNITFENSPDKSLDIKEKVIPIKKNLRITFEKDLTLKNFHTKYGTEEQCFNALFNLKWPNGFICPNCGHTSYWKNTNKKNLELFNVLIINVKKILQLLQILFISE
jgi:hypothetical protein